MSLPPPPPHPPGSYPAPPRRRRPRKIWFVIGGALVVLAPIVFVGALFTVLRPLMQEDAVFAVSSTPVQVDLPEGEERALFTDSGFGVDCTVSDGSGEQLDLRPVTGDFTYNEWTAVARFDTGDGDVTFECRDGAGMGMATGDRVRIAQLPSTGGFVGGIVIGIVGPLLLGGIGVVMLIVTGVLWATGAPREESGAA